MNCSRCGAANTPGTQFCRSCGQRLAGEPRPCPACGLVNPPAAAFCGRCGTGLAPAAAPPPAGGLILPDSARPGASPSPPAGPAYGPPPGSAYSPAPGPAYGPPPGPGYGPPPGPGYGPSPGPGYGPPPGPGYGPPPGPGYGPPGPQVAPRRRGGCSCGGCLLALLIVVLLLAGSGVGVYLLIQNGTLSQHTILNMVGLGTGEIQVTNLADSTLAVTVTTVGSPTPAGGTGSDGGGASSTHSLKTMEMQEFTGIKPGRYDLQIGTGASSGPCTLKIDSGDVYHVAILRTGIVITRDKEPGQSKADVLFPASGLCQR